MKCQDASKDALTNQISSFRFIRSTTFLNHSQRQRKQRQTYTGTADIGNSDRPISGARGIRTAAGDGRGSVASPSRRRRPVQSRPAAYYTVSCSKCQLSLPGVSDVREHRAGMRGQASEPKRLTDDTGATGAWWRCSIFVMVGVGMEINLATFSDFC